MWGFLFLMFLLKIPLAMLIWLVWWAIHQTPEEEQAQSEGGGPQVPASPHPRTPSPRPPRRGPHREPAAPPRVRAVLTRTPEREH